MSILDSIPDISFIGDISVEKLKEIGINEYKSALLGNHRRNSYANK